MAWLAAHRQQARYALQTLGWGLAVVGLFLYARIFESTLIDDTYITLMYVRNLADHLAWGFFPGETSNTATSPLNVMVLAVLDRVVGSPVTAVSLAMAPEWTLTLAVLLRISRRIIGTAHAGVAVFAIVVTNPLLLSGIGLEGSLYVVLLLAALALFMGERWWWVAVVAGLLTLTRPDGVIVLAVVLALAPVGWRVRLRMLVVYGLTILPWALFSWVHLGSLVPDTLLIKVNQQPWDGTTLFGNGPLLYFDRLPAATIASIWPVLFAPLALPALRRCSPLARRALAALVVYAVAHYLAYAALAVPPFHWYYTHQVIAVAVLGGFGLAEAGRRLPTGHATRQAVRWGVVILPLASLLTLLTGQGTPLGQAAIHSNWARPAQYQAMAEELREILPPGTEVDFRGEVGTLAYFSERYLRDIFTDRARADAEIDRLRADRSGPTRWLLDLNFLWRDAAPALPAPTYLLEFGAPRVSSDPDQSADPTLVDSWITWTRWVPFNRIVLHRLPGEDAVAIPERPNTDSASDERLTAGAGRETAVPVRQSGNGRVEAGGKASDPGIRAALQVLIGLCLLYFGGAIMVLCTPDGDWRALDQWLSVLALAFLLGAGCCLWQALA
jgi:hypothetical protein